MHIPVMMTVDFFKDGGEWVATANIPTTDGQIHKLKKADEFNLNAVCDFIRAFQGELTSTDDYYWAVSIACIFPEDEKNMHEFCRFLRKP